MPGQFDRILRVLFWSGRWAKRLALVVLILLALLALGNASLQFAAGRKLDAQLKLMERGFEALTLADLYDRRTKLPDEDNSALVVMTHYDELELLQESNDAWWELPVIGNARMVSPGLPVWTTGQIELMRDFVQVYGDVIADLDRVHDLPYGRYPVNVDRMIRKGEHPHCRPARMAARMETLATYVDVADGRLDSALARCRTMLHLARPFQDEPMLIPALVGLACNALAVDALQVVLAAGTLDSASLRHVEWLLTHSDVDSDLAFALRGERLLAREMPHAVWGDAMSRRAGARRFSPARYLSLRGVGFVTMNEAKVLEIMTDLVYAQSDPLTALARTDEIEQHVAALGPQYAMAKMLIPSVKRAVELSLRLRCVLASARVGLAAERYRLDRGDWPETLNDLVPEYVKSVPTDYFSGQPLRYVRDDQGVSIYTIGDDGVDNGGDIMQKAGHRPTDWGFRLLHPELRGVRIVENDEKDGDQADE